VRAAARGFRIDPLVFLPVDRFGSTVVAERSGPLVPVDVAPPRREALRP
jgi:hypothetical protein